MSILSKKQMSEEDIKLQYITPAITSKWDVKKITMETKLTVLLYGRESKNFYSCQQ